MQQPNLTPADVDATVIGVDYHRFPGTTMTVCCLHLANGHAVVGQSACINPANFETEMGQSLARADAIREVWRLEGYLMRERFGRGKRALGASGKAVVA